MQDSTKLTFIENYLTSIVKNLKDSTTEEDKGRHRAYTDALAYVSAIIKSKH